MSTARKDPPSTPATVVSVESATPPQTGGQSGAPVTSQASKASATPAPNPAAALLVASPPAESSTKITITEKTLVKDLAHEDAPSKQTLTSEVIISDKVATTNPQPAIATLPSTTTVIATAPQHEHITIAPEVSPIVAVAISPNAPEPATVKVEVKPETAHLAVQRVDTLADLPAHVGLRSRRNSDSEQTSSRPRPGAIPLPVVKAASSSDLRSGLASPGIPSGAVEVLIASVHATTVAHTPSASAHADPLSLLILHAGRDKKPFQIHRHLLVTKVPFFGGLLSREPAPASSRLTFEDLDEYGFALFVRWLYDEELNGPHDFHSFTHYLSLYCLALQFNVDDLQNLVMDLCRLYYHHNSMTAPAYRIDYIYTFTPSANRMRIFLTTTAAYRCLCEAPPSPDTFLSDSMKGVIVRGGDACLDFAEALIRLSKNGLVDVRKGNDCEWHVHSDGRVCETVGLEPYENA